MSDLREFEFTDIHKWKQQVLSDLEPDNIEKLLAIELAGELIQPPYVDITSAPKHHLVRSYRNCTAHDKESWKGSRYWMHMEPISAGTTAVLNQLALTALNGGSEGVIVEVEGLTAWDQLLSGISLADCYLGIKGSALSVGNMLDYIKSQQLPLQGFIEFSDLDHQINGGLLLQDLLDSSGDVRVLALGETVSENGTLQELALLLSHVVWLLNQLMEVKIPLTTILANLQLKLELSNAYLWEVCRIRCLRTLFHQIVCQYGVNYHPKSLMIHATTTGLQAKEEDTNYQLISNTTQGMAAVLGGADIITITPHIQGWGTEAVNAQRIARNVSHILREESHLHRVADPVAGSYYLEALTLSMMKKVWSKFQQYELNGGYTQISIIPS